jgi:K+/H+ antiporter YhaU regulatory subunit KhtT
MKSQNQPIQRDQDTVDIFHTFTDQEINRIAILLSSSNRIKSRFNDINLDVVKQFIFETIKCKPSTVNTFKKLLSL